ncbi:MAG: hypothetical protein AB7O66_11975 [Limisphaerales bacterium]
MKIGYHFALRWALWKRLSYARRLAVVARAPQPLAPATDATLYAFSGTRDLPEQVASLKSFLRHAADPKRIVIVGDGTHTESDRAVLRSVHPRLETVPWDSFLGHAVPEVLLAYARAHPLGKKIAVLLSVPASGPWVFSDSDILFFPGAADLRERLAPGRNDVEYLEDCYPSLDGRLIRDEAEKEAPVNSGFVIVHRPLDWSEALERFAGMSGEPGYFTEQTLFHLTIRRSGGRALPKDRYVIQSDDQWIARDLHTGPDVALRHYFSSLRYKMWLKV